MKHDRGEPSFYLALRVEIGPHVQRCVAAVRSLARDEGGAALIEYTTLTGILVVAVIGAIISVASWVGGLWTRLNGLLPP